MNRKLKMLGPAFTAVLAIAAISASPASAKGSFTAAKYPVVITAVNEGRGTVLRNDSGKSRMPWCSPLREQRRKKPLQSHLSRHSTAHSCLTAGTIPSIVDPNNAAST